MTPAENAQLALLLEVAGTPKPGNVDRNRDFPDLRFEHFLAGSVGAGAGLRTAEEGGTVGEAFEQAVAGMSQQRGGNTQFGALLLLIPLVRAAAEVEGEGELSPESAREIAENTTVADAANFYRAFDRVDVFVDDPPEDAEPLDVRRGSEAISALEDRELSLYDVMEMSAPEDGVAAEWVSGFQRAFRGGERIEELDGPVSDRSARLFLELLADEPDTLVAKQHGREIAEQVSEHAGELLDASAAESAVSAWGEDLVERGINPGTTADVTAAALFVALEREEVDV